MEYNHIKNYLDKIKNILLSKEESLSIISKTIEGSISIKIETKNIKISNSIIYIKANPIIKNEILIKKRKVLENLSLLLPEKIFTDIR